MVEMIEIDPVPVGLHIALHAERLHAAVQPDCQHLLGRAGNQVADLPHSMAGDHDPAVALAIHFRAELPCGENAASDCCRASGRERPPDNPGQR